MHVDLATVKVPVRKRLKMLPNLPKALASSTIQVVNGDLEGEREFKSHVMSGKTIADFVMVTIKNQWP